MMSCRRYILVGITVRVSGDPSAAFVLRFDPHVYRDRPQNYRDFVAGQGDGVAWVAWQPLFLHKTWMVCMPLNDDIDIDRYHNDK